MLDGPLLAKAWRWLKTVGLNGDKNERLPIENGIMAKQTKND
jgi:hypothetical protein